MDSRASGKNAVRLVLVLWGGLYLAVNPFRALNNGDLYWQRWLGDYILQWHRLPTALGTETFTAAGAPWVPQEWFISIFVALAMRHGLLVPFAILMAVIPIGILASIYVRSTKGATPEAIAIVLMFTGCALAASFGIRAQVLGWGCFAAFLLCLDRRDAWAYAAVPVVVLWANVHASVMLAPVFVLARVIGEMATSGVRSLHKSRDLRILALMLPAVLCTPLGWHLPVYALMLSMSPIRHFIQEWQPVALSDGAFLFGAFPLALLVAAGGLRESLRDKKESLPLALLFVAVLLANRNVPLFAIASAPLAARSLDVLAPGLYRLRGRIAEMERFAVVSIVVVILSAAALLALVERRDPPQSPVAAITSASQDRDHHRLLCENFNACSAALQYPQLRVFMDGRADPYPLNIWRSYISVIRVNPLWAQKLQHYGADLLLASRGSPFSQAVAANPNWRTRFQDAAFVLYVRN